MCLQFFKNFPNSYGVSTMESKTAPAPAAGQLSVAWKQNGATTVPEPLDGACVQSISDVLWGNYADGAKALETLKCSYALVADNKASLTWACHNCYLRSDTYACSLLPPPPSTPTVVTGYIRVTLANAPGTVLYISNAFLRNGFRERDLLPASPLPHPSTPPRAARVEHGVLLCLALPCCRLLWRVN